MGALQRLVFRARQVCASQAPDVPSPCLSVCRMDPETQWCVGCLRTLDEVAEWSRMEDDGKREVWRLIAERALTSTVSPGPASVTSLTQREQTRSEKTERT